MLAKLIAYAETRDEALDKLDRALDETSIFGITTNLKFLKRLIALPATRSATFYTRLIDEQMKELLDKGTDTDTEALALGAYYWMIRQRQPAVNGPWQSLATTGWQMSAGGEGLSPIPILHLETDKASAGIRFAPLKPDDTMIVGINDEQLPVKLIPISDERFTAIIGGRREVVRIYQADQTIFVHDHRGVHTLKAIPYLSYISASVATSGELRAPMMGMILKVNVSVGDKVKAGDVAAILESMKMELSLEAPRAGKVAKVLVHPGKMVELGATLLELEV